MPESPTANMLLVKPTEGSDSGIWDTEMNTALDLIDAHDHSSGKGVTVKTAGITINADLTFTSAGTARAATDVKAVDFAPSATSGMTAYAGALFCNQADNELYWRTTSGTNVQLTSGTSLNVGAFVGGIGGDYSSVSALVDFDDASDTYRFRQQVNTGVRQFAKMQCGDVKFMEYKVPGAGVPSFGVTVKSPAAVGADYTITLPGAVPGANGTLAQFTTAGVMSFANTNLASITMASGATITTSGAGNVVVGGTGTLSVAGLTTATGGVTCGSNTHVTVSGTGQFKHGSRIRWYDGLWAVVTSGTPTFGSLHQYTGVSTLRFPVDLEEGKRILELAIVLDRGGAGTISYALKRNDTTAFTTVASGSDAASSGKNSQSLTSINHTMLTGNSYFVEVSGGNAANIIYQVDVAYDQP